MVMWTRARRYDWSIPDAVLDRMRDVLLGRVPLDAPEPAYAHEYGRNNGDGTFSVEIVRGEVKPHHSPCKDWPIKPLYTRPTGAPL